MVLVRSSELGVKFGLFDKNSKGVVGTKVEGYGSFSAQ